MNRRRFLQLSAFGVTAGAVSLGSGPAQVTPQELLDLLGPETVRGLGRRYREMVPAADLLSATTSRGSISRRIRDDFARGRTVVVGGWVLSLTEARQCALFSLLPA
ncbi:MAG TPA: twin-arginine translocation signal domain-containing protein [Gemmatimonadales bacterium]|nr:twin-arginine translocation signal domain-containing protein [Gemmatimonadales bacterium]